MLASNIKQKPSLPKLLRKIPTLFALFHSTAHGIYPYIFVPKEIHENLTSSNPDPYNVSLITHEQTHLDRQKQYGWFQWMSKYVFNSRFRFAEEIMADKVAMRYLKKHKLPYPLEKRAKMLSSWLYFRPVTYEVALQEIKKAWEEA